MGIMSIQERRFGRAVCDAGKVSNKTTSEKSLGDDIFTALKCDKRYCRADASIKQSERAIGIYRVTHPQQLINLIRSLILIASRKVALSI